jgi:hypothetical protein
MKMHTDNEDYRRRLAAEAERLRASGALGRSDLLIRLFDFLLQASLSGRAPKEIEIAHEVFEKSGEIRAGQDAPVRTYVHRLRRKLEEAYTDADANLGDATDRLVLLRGEYRLTLADEPLLVKLVSPPFRKRGRSWIGAAAVLLLAVNLGLWFVFTGQPARISSDNVGSTAFWKPLSIPHRPVIVVMGDHYLFGESPGSMEMTHLVRRFDVNSPDDLEAYLAANPNEVGHYVDLGVHYVPVSVALALAEVLPIIARTSPEKALRAPLMISQLSPDLLRTGDTIYIGFLGTLGLIRDPLYATSGFRFGDHFDELIDKASGRRFIADKPIAGEIQTPRRQYAYLASLDGPTGNRILVISGTNETGLVQAAEIVADVHQLRRLSQKVGDGSFEALYEVSTLGAVNIDSNLILARPLTSPPVWPSQKPSSTAASGR